MRATMDLITLYNYNPDVLDGLVIPGALDRGLLIENLLLETAEQEILYPSYGFMKAAIESWSKRKLHVWEELYKTTQYEYNPIWNKDGKITETITRDLAGSENVNDDNTMTNDLKQTVDSKVENDLHSTNDATRTNNVYGYNSSSSDPKDKEVIAEGGSNTGTVEEENTIKNTGTVTDNRDIKRETTDTGTITTERTEAGNIGITTTQQMIKEQREVVELNLYDVIINDFKDRFCLLVY